MRERSIAKPYPTLKLPLPASWRALRVVFAILTVFYAGLAGLAAQSCDPPPAGLVSWWPGDGNANDIVGSNPGDPPPNSGFYSAGLVGRGFNFNGFGMIVPDSPSLEFSTGMTVEAWINSQPNGNDAAIFSKWDVFPTNGCSYLCAVSGAGAPYFAISTDGDGADLQAATSSIPVVAFEWTHVAGTYDGTTLCVYVNGVLTGTNSCQGDIFPGIDDAGIGAIFGPAPPPSQPQRYYSTPFVGLIDEVAVYDRALSPAEIQTIYAAGAAGKCRGSTGPPVIDFQPVKQSVNEKGTATLEVVAEGAQPLNYTWRRNGANIPGANFSVLTLPDIQLGQSGVYSVVVTNSAGSVTSTNALLTVIPLPPCAAPPAGLVSWWPGERNANDVAGGNSGKFISYGATGYSTGEVNEAFYFDEYSGIDVPNSASLQFGPAMSWELWSWASPYGNPAGLTVISKWDSVNDSQCAYLIYFDANGFVNYAVSTNGTSEGAVVAVSTRPVPATSWHHIAGTFDRNSLAIYIDGTIAGGAPCTGTIFAGTNDFGIGVEIETNMLVRPFWGLLDEVSVYDRALLASEIHGLYAAGAAGKCEGPNVPPEIDLQPTNQTIVQGRSAAFLVIAAGSEPLTYAWRFNGTNLAGADGPALILNDVPAAKAGDYTVVVANASGSITSSVAVLTVLVPPPCEPASAGIVSWWSAEGNTFDRVGGNTGMLVNNVTYGEGEVGGAFGLAGSYVRVPDAPNLRFTNAMTVEAWINPSATSVYEQAIVSKWDAVAGENQAAYTCSVGGSGYPYFGVSAGGTIVSAASGVPVVANQWSHFAGTYDGSFVRVYVNGVLRGSAACSGNIFYGTDDVGIGAVIGKGGGLGSPFVGSLDEISLYNRALSATEIHLIYANGIGGKCPPSPAPAITSQPVGGNFQTGSTVTLATGVSGATPMYFQWYFVNEPLAGATNSSLTLTNLSADDDGNYLLVAVNDYGAATSSNALVSASLAGTPGFIWYRPAANGAVFAVDAQTNVYVNRAGTVVVYNDAGVPVQTNAICPVPGLAQRDAAGNFYFAGSFTPPVDFGGETLETNSCFLAKYTSDGALVWVEGFAPSGVISGHFLPINGNGANNLILGDLQVEPGGVAYVSASWTLYQQFDLYQTFGDVYRFNADGSPAWKAPVAGFYFDPLYVIPFEGIALGAVSATNCYALALAAYQFEHGTFQDFPYGAQNTLAEWQIVNPSRYPSLGSHPVAGDGGGIFNVEAGFLTERDNTGRVMIRVPAGLDNSAHTVAGDLWGGVHVADGTGMVARFDSVGNQVWSINLSAQCNAMVVDPGGNRFITVTNGGLYALRPEVIAPLVITNAPQGVTVMGGSTVTLSVGVSGGAPLSYQWLDGVTPISGATNTTLTLTGATSAQSGAYAVVVSNPVGSVTTAPAVVRIKNVELFNGSQLLTNGTYAFATNPVLTIQSRFTNGTAFYTLDGSTPNFLSTPYSGLIPVTSNATVSAIGYSVDFSQSEYADSVMIALPPKYTLTASTLGGGTVSVSPPGTGVSGDSVTYLSNTIATVTANAASGWSFLHWTGAAGGTNPVINITMTQDATLGAVFGTGVGTTVVGNGQIIVYPASGPYPYGSVVRLLGFPGAGSYFGVWGNAGSGTANPLYITVTNANATVSSIFGATTANQAALTVLISGQGKVGVSPSGNVFAPGQQLTLTATPNAGASFLHWSGGAGGTQNPLTLTLNQSAVIAANFTGETATLSAVSTGQTSAGFIFALTSDPGSIYQILVSTNLNTWQSLGTVTNITGQARFTDTNTAGARTRFYRAEQ